MAESPVATVTLTLDQWYYSVLAAIRSAHGEFCIPSDNCDCIEMEERIEKQVKDHAQNS